MHAHRVIIAVALGVGLGASTKTAPNLDELMTRVGERIAEYYRRAQAVICTEKSTVQPIGLNLTPQGFPRTVESELRVETDAPDGDGPPEAKVLREIRKVN